MAKKKPPAPVLPAWTTINTHLTLYHGCVATAAARIRVAVGTRIGSPNTDFGCGFYTTTRLDQAEEWARERYWDKYPAGNPVDLPVAVQFVVPLADLADLNSLMFVRGDPTNVTFWSLIRHCRAGNSHAHPVRISPNDWYDMVVGPVASWPPKAGKPLYSLGAWDGTNWAAYDQFSFHTAAATTVLNSLNRANPAEFDVLPVKP